jgi:hypothetical protein
MTMPYLYIYNFNPFPLNVKSIFWLISLEEIHVDSNRLMLSCREKQISKPIETRILYPPLRGTAITKWEDTLIHNHFMKIGYIL